MLQALPNPIPPPFVPNASVSIGQKTQWLEERLTRADAAVELGVAALRAADTEIALLRRWLEWAYVRLPMTDKIPLNKILGHPYSPSP